MHSGFHNLRSALPMNLKAHFPGFSVWTGAQGDIERVCAIWRECLDTYGGPYLFGGLSLADAMYAPVCTRFLTYDVKLDSDCAGYCETISNWPAMHGMDRSRTSSSPRSWRSSTSNSRHLPAKALALAERPMPLPHAPAIVAPHYPLTDWFAIRRSDRGIVARVTSLIMY